MPVVYVQRYAVGGALVTGGTQYIEGTLTISGATTIYLDPTVFTVAGTYTLFDYSAVGASFAFAPYANKQACLDALVTINTSLLSGLTATDIHGTDHSGDPTPSNTITVTLV